jgi:TonB family protein
MLIKKSLGSIALVALCLTVVAPVAAQDAAPRKITQKAKAVYPQLGRPMRLSGTVKLALTVGVDGKVKDAKVTGGHPILAVAAVSAARQFQFERGPKETIEPAVFQFDYAQADAK